MAAWTHTQWIARLEHEMKNAKPERLKASLRQAEQHLEETQHDEQESDWVRLLYTYQDAIAIAGERHD